MAGAMRRAGQAQVGQVTVPVDPAAQAETPRLVQPAALAIPPVPPRFRRTARHARSVAKRPAPTAGRAAVAHARAACVSGNAMLPPVLAEPAAALADSPVSPALAADLAPAAHPALAARAPRLPRTVQQRSPRRTAPAPGPMLVLTPAAAASAPTTSGLACDLTRTSVHAFERGKRGLIEADSLAAHSFRRR